MNARWPLPSRNRMLENDKVRINAVRYPDDVPALFEAASFEANQADLFRYHVNVPVMADVGTYDGYLRTKIESSGVTYKVFSKRLERYVGCASLINIKQDHGTIEVGSIWYAKAAQRTEINTNTMLLLFSYVFDELSYRRLEWKCNNNNEESKRAALRLGFEYEGLFRQHMVSRGENRDTAWFSIIDKDWPETKKHLEELANREYLAAPEAAGGGRAG